MVARTTTRSTLLAAAFAEIHEHGYHATSLDDILQRTGLTKGALYHHFGSKVDLSTAVLDEVVRELILERWVKPVVDAENPLDGLAVAVRRARDELTDDDARCGCPLNNLNQEMSATTPEFSQRIAGLYDAWRGELSEALRRGQRRGHVRGDVDPSTVADFLVATNQGVIGQIKARGLDAADSLVAAYLDYLTFLRADPTKPGEGGG